MYSNDILDVESFLLNTLHEECLSEPACCEKDALLNKLKVLQDEYPQLRRFESELVKQPETTTTTLMPREPPRQQTKQTVCSDESNGKQHLCLLLTYSFLCSWPNLLESFRDRSAHSKPKPWDFLEQLLLQADHSVRVLKRNNLYICLFDTDRDDV